MPQHLQPKYRWLVVALNTSTVAAGCVIVALAILKSRQMLGLPAGSVPLEGVRMQFFVWGAICLVAIPVGFYLARIVLYGIFGILMVPVGLLTVEEAKQFALHSSIPNAWSESPSNHASKATELTGNLVSGLISGDQDAIAAFGESDNCVVVDWRDGAEEIFEAITPFLPEGYLRAEKRSSTKWAVEAGSRPVCAVEFSQQKKQEEFFVVLNQLLAPDFELWQYTPVNGDGYSLYLAPSAWWKSLAAEHPTALAKYFLSADRLAAYWRKNYLARLFSRP